MEIRIAVGPDGIAEPLDFPLEEDDIPPQIERDEKLEQEIEWEARQPLDAVIDDWDDPSATSDPVRMYLHEIGRTALLSGEEEVSLAATINEGKRGAERLKDGDIDDETRDGLILLRRSAGSRRSSGWPRRTCAWSSAWPNAMSAAACRCSI